MSTLQTGHKSCFVIKSITNACSATNFLIQYITDNTVAASESYLIFLFQAEWKDF